MHKRSHSLETEEAKEEVSKQGETNKDEDKNGNKSCARHELSIFQKRDMG